MILVSFIELDSELSNGDHLLPELRHEMEGIVLEKDGLNHEIPPYALRYDTFDEIGKILLILLYLIQL